MSGEAAGRGSLGACFLLLRELVDQVPDGCTIGYPLGQSATVDHIVHTDRATVRVIAAPHTRVRIESEAGGVVVAEQTAVTSVLGPPETSMTPASCISWSVGRAALSRETSAAEGAARHRREGRGGCGSTGSLRKGKWEEARAESREAMEDEGTGRQRCPDGWIDTAMVQAPQILSSQPSPVAERREGAKKKPRAQLRRVPSSRMRALSRGGRRPRCARRGWQPQWAAGAPALARQIVVPVHNDQSDRNVELGVGVEEPVAGTRAVRDGDLVRAKPGLELARHLHPGNILS